MGTLSLGRMAARGRRGDRSLSLFMKKIVLLHITRQQYLPVDSTVIISTLLAL
jgi:hypothetical protein